MTLETKYSIGDTVFYIQKNKVDHAEITDINIIINNRNKIPNEIIYAAFEKFVLKEQFLFSSKQELLESL